MRIAKNPLDSFRYAVEGIVYTFRTQKHMRFHFFSVVLVLLVGLLFRLDKTEMVILLFTVSMVLVAEMFNTAVEAVVDLITDSYHPLAKLAKDIAAGAVLVTTVNAIVVGFLLFLTERHLDEIRLNLQEHKPDPLVTIVVGMVLLLLIIILGKVVGRKGLLLRGGVISGHSALGFFMAMTIVFLSNNLLMAILALSMAVLIAQSRVEGRIHTLQEVLLGALVAVLLAGAIYWLA
ncbi:MAG: diacylglycerol kinase [Armatimonadota bacterium]|nr:diacylglycerol kinase [bacterium]MCS7309049.1 diacylglycerol kinase [Armatimonadota bacterium]MDW8103812.1 diacylglycerol kinase [Armatimonadota bacterium]MDW8289404.1 diacylglycerol kinase [Armatimonadota bacterium]